MKATKIRKKTRKQFYAVRCRVIWLWLRKSIGPKCIAGDQQPNAIVIGTGGVLVARYDQPNNKWSPVTVKMPENHYVYLFLDW